MILWSIAAFTAYFVKGLCSFANTLIFTTILSFGASNASISPVDLLLGYPANLILTWKNRRSLDPMVFLPLVIQVLTGSIPGALMLRNADARPIKLVFGVVVIADNTFRIFLYKGLGLLTPDTLKSVILLIPSALLGLFTGVKCCGHMNDKKVRRITTVLLILSGISLVLRNL